MKYRPFSTLVATSAFVAVIAAWSCMSKPTTDASSVGFLNGSSAPCGPEIEIDREIGKLSSQGSAANQVVTLLLDRANGSPACRKDIIGALIKAMNNPPLSFVGDRSSFFLWSHGSAILGKLKAVEALDLLIDHLDLNDGLFSASMVHQPAILGVKEMGVMAVPKLGLALQHNTNRNIRLAAVLCLADIGGAEANNALKQALGSEKDQCVRRFISLSILSPDDKHKSRREPSESAHDADVLWQRIVAFRCDN